jgi:TonB family protein
MKECVLFIPRVVRIAVLFVIAGAFATGAFAEDTRKAKSEVKPVFPELARKMNLSGTVKVQIEISPAGAVTSAKALGGHPLFIDSAVEAVKRWKFESASSTTSQIVEFKFNNPSSR